MANKRRGGRVTPKGTGRAKPAGSDVDFAGLAAGLQESLSAAQADLADEEVTGTAGGGLVSITLSGDGEARAVHIDPAVYDPADPGLLEDLVLVALRAAQDAAAERRSEAMSSATGGIDLGALGGLGGLLG